MLIVGLGNYGETYENTVHNIGFMAVDSLLDKLNLKLKEKSCKALWTTYFCKGEKNIIAKPQTYMNLSGEAVKELVGANKWNASDVLIIYDDIDLPIGSVRIRKDGSGGTHNGMKNIIEQLGTKDILRIRVGVGDDRGQMELKDYVLSKLRGEKKARIDKILSRVADCIIEYCNDRDVDAIMRKYSGVYE
ncbi:MAG: aminoacyl-tRNA hydrolase [Clostridia bacterium]